MENVKSGIIFFITESSNSLCLKKPSLVTSLLTTLSTKDSNVNLLPRGKNLLKYFSEVNEIK